MSAHKFLQKLWNLDNNIANEIKKNHEKDFDDELNKFTNKKIKEITNNLTNFSYNKLIANMHEIYSFLSKKITNPYTKKTLVENYNKILTIILPIVPHFALECLEKNNLDANLLWPSYDKSVLIENNINYVIQINGKKRSLINTKRDINENDLMKEIENIKKVKKYFLNKKIKRIIFIKNKLINIIL